MKTRVILDVDQGLLFDMLRKMDGDTSSFGSRVAGELLTQGTSLFDALGLGVYGVFVVSKEKLPEDGR